MTSYSWQLTAVAVAVFVPLLPILAAVQRRQLAAHDEVRASVGGTLSEVSELVSGAPVVLAYGLPARSRRRLDRAIMRQYRAQLGAVRWLAVMFPLAASFGAVVQSAVVDSGVAHGEPWGRGA